MVNTCTLGASYETAPEDQAAKDELACDRENADAARACAKLHQLCGHALEQ